MSYFQETIFFTSAYIYCCFIKNRKCERKIRDKPSICFSGCGARSQFYGGVAEYVVDNFKTDNIDILCVSGGVFAATILALQRKMTTWSQEDWPKCYDYWSSRSLYLYLDNCEFHRNLWRTYLPDDAYKICSDRLFISISRLGFFGFYEDVISTYKSNEELIDAICGTIHIPGLFYVIPTVHGRYAFDGCFTNLKPRTDTKFSTIIVNLFGRGHIDNGNRLSITNLMSIVIPKYFKKYIDEGYYKASLSHQLFIKNGFVAND